ncbi:hypothetical protein GP486_004699 [Trichoglossum hirsutum]|uniref:BZIP domain-containing protein n=1 Tax=Trichoglossum hirsutum TaxID=265104 RepID=A0A9P8LAK2_9PEZI|nr:hypothetical protein GP486_004699 [Trichoglossum hirsutum]
MDFSPVDSLLSAPDDGFVSLFGDENASMASVSVDSIPTPPRSVNGNNSSSNSSRTSTQEPEKKPPKKRKSWGQELPTPTTNLPPRKRAKTEAEKEQRRIERVLRNRAAAQSSRERKRKEVEALEDEKLDIERENRRLNNRLLEVEQQNLQLSRQIAEMAAKMTVFQRQLSGGVGTPDSSARVSPIISQSGSSFRAESVKLEYEQDLDFSLPPPHSTLDPNALLSSPSEASIDDPTATTLDMTQHPAEMLCDQQCLSRVTRLPWGQAMGLDEEQSRHTAFLTLVATLTQLLFLTMSSTVFSLLHRPSHQIFSSLKTGNPLPAISTTSMTMEAYSISRLILWLTSTPLNRPSAATTTTPSNRSRENQRATFRIRLLERLLACSPALARPLKDATASALQLVSDSIAESRSGRANGDSLADRREMASLMTMLWAIESIEGPLRKCRADFQSDRRDEDPAGDIRRLCIALDGLSNRGESFDRGKGSKNHDEWDGGLGYESGATRRLESLDLAFSSLTGKHGTGL